MMDDAPAAAPAPSPPASVSTLYLDYDRRMTSNMLSKGNKEHDKFLDKRQWRDPEPRPPPHQQEDQKKEISSKYYTFTYCHTVTVDANSFF